MPREAELLTTGAVFVADKLLGKSGSRTLLSERGLELVCAKFLTGAVREPVGAAVC